MAVLGGGERLVVHGSRMFNLITRDDQHYTVLAVQLLQLHILNIIITS